MAVDLVLNPETVRMLVQKARAVNGSLRDSFEDGHEGEVEFDPDMLSAGHHHEGLAEEENDDSTEEELIELLEDLNVDEAAELVAIVWVGRGDFEASDFASAVEEARGRAAGPTAQYLTGMPMLAEYLEAGLDALEL